MILDKVKKILKRMADLQIRILLTLVYFILLLPIGIMVRFFSDQLATKSNNKKRSCYWVSKKASLLSEVEKARRQY